MRSAPSPKRGNPPGAPDRAGVEGRNGDVEPGHPARPGWRIGPKTRAKVVISSKYTIAFKPIRPTDFTSPTLAIRVTMSQKTSGATIFFDQLDEGVPRAA
ncbi:hypothetical protein OG876_32725 [Kribbella sp. NBC_00359]